MVISDSGERYTVDITIKAPAIRRMMRQRNPALGFDSLYQEVFSVFGYSISEIGVLHPFLPKGKTWLHHFYGSETLDMDVYTSGIKATIEISSDNPLENGEIRKASEIIREKLGGEVKISYHAFVPRIENSTSSKSSSSASRARKDSGR